MMDARKIRKELGYPGFTYSVRCWHDGSAWVCPYPGRKDRMDQLVIILNELGYRTECMGEPGTSGEYIIDIFPKN